MYLLGTETVSSYFESRNGARFDETVFVGLQALLIEHLVGVVVTREKIEQAAKLSKAHFGNDKIFNRAGWEYILNEHGGKLPVRIMAVPEGTPVTVSNVMMTVENTDPKCFWLTNHLETLLTHVWYASTVATLSRETKKIIKHYLERTADNLGGLNFMLHDFGFRGVSSVESAAMGGMGHLVNFLGTDTVVAMEAAMEYYDADINNLAFSVPATEHSVMTSGGPEGEVAVVRRLIEAYPDGILAMVIDSYNDKNFITNVIGKTLKDEILGRNGVTVFRPDSGDPEQVTLDVVERLGAAFGFTRNNKGYRVLNPKVRVLWGDGIDMRGVDNILGTLLVNGWSAENMVFGMGGGLLQKVNRDTQRFAFKCSAQKRNGVWYDIYKNPLDKSKASKRGHLALVRNADGKLETIPARDTTYNLLVPVFENGVLLKRYTFAEVRKNAEI
jgi:nicotinamide phosphoribosyltransferase